MKHLETAIQLAQIAAANFVLIADAIVKVTMPGTIYRPQHLMIGLTNSNRLTVDAFKTST